VTAFPDGFPGPAYPLGANPSFTDLVRRLVSESPDAVVARGDVAGGARLDAGRLDPSRTMPGVPHGTTVLALKFADGIVMAGDRRATEGYSIADERIEKVFPADDHSAVAIAGAAGQATEIVKLFQTEIEHYEKVEGDRLSLEGKANRLAQMIRGNLPMAMQGLVVVPLFAGWDVGREEGRIFRYDVTGGRWEEAVFHATGSGGIHARGTLKKRWKPGLDREAAIRTAVEALYDAAQEDVATGGPDLFRGVYPSVKVVDRDGFHTIPEGDVRAAFEGIVEDLLASQPPIGASGAREAEEAGE
jgi:proteasome beta subunit